MATERETILQALAAALAAGLTPPFRRNDEVPTRIPAAGLVIMDDGEAGEPVEVTMSPVRYHYEHAVEVSVLVQAEAGREEALDAICEEIGAVVAVDRGLGGLVDYLEAAAPVPAELPVEGGASIRAATVPLILHYAVSDPLS